MVVKFAKLLFYGFVRLRLKFTNLNFIKNRNFVSLGTPIYQIGSGYETKSGLTCKKSYYHNFFCGLFFFYTKSYMLNTYILNSFSKAPHFDLNPFYQPNIFSWNVICIENYFISDIILKTNWAVWNYCNDSIAQYIYIEYIFL